MRIRISRRSQGCAGGRYSRCSHSPQGAVTRRERQQKLVDVAQLTLGGALFTAVAALTGAVMAVGFVVLTGIDRVRRH